VKPNVSSSGGGAGRFRTTLGNAGSFSARRQASDSQVAVHKLYPYPLGAVIHLALTGLDRQNGELPWFLSALQNYIAGKILELCHSLIAAEGWIMP